MEVDWKMVVGAFAVICMLVAYVTSLNKRLGECEAGSVPDTPALKKGKPKTKTTDPFVV